MGCWAHLLPSMAALSFSPVKQGEVNICLLGSWRFCEVTCTVVHVTHGPE